MLALRSRGLGTAWTTLHLYHEKEVAALLGIPDHVLQPTAIPPGTCATLQALQFHRANSASSTAASVGMTQRSNTTPQWQRFQPVAVTAERAGTCEELPVRAVGASELLKVRDQHRLRLRHGRTVDGATLEVNVGVLGSILNGERLNARLGKLAIHRCAGMSRTPVSRHRSGHER